MSECKGTLQQHIGLLLNELPEIGFGGACETSYKALVEVAEASRLTNGFPVYVPVIAQELAATAMAYRMGLEAHGVDSEEDACETGNDGAPVGHRGKSS